MSIASPQRPPPLATASAAASCPSGPKTGDPR
eukprot:CAMPEP_0115247364 /NCGR_PEP_ID=MMETSP0270-20121206/41512_1 /TAXON_ID=71861 /ORGANISM="Scrippsiella trochoidea, Strain CCMP3099" /LENGTH=31 /DNA_ID= /DNA_START= /DNA_END= /DNA_ORIENTATION=